MAIDSPLTIALFAALALLSILGATWWGPRLVGSWWKTTLRFGSVLMSCVMFALALAVQQNASNQWYVTWGSLVGADDGTMQQSDSGGSASELAKTKQEQVIQALGQEPTAFPPLPNPGERIQQYDAVKGARSGLVGKVSMVLPASYDHAKPRNYPVIYALHGTPGSRVAYWGKDFDMRKYFDPLTEKGTVGEVIFVVPQLNFPEGTDSECVNGSKSKPHVEDWLAEDVLAFVGQHVRVQRTASSWATMGYSAGGYCAAMLGIHHPEKFGAAVMLGGYFRPVWESSTPWLSAGSAEFKKYDLVAQLKNAMPPIALFVQVGTTGYNNAYADTKTIQALATKPFVLTAVIDENSGHMWPSWRKRLPEAAQFLSRSLPPFKATQH